MGRYASKLAKSPRIREQIELLQQAVRAHFVIMAPKAADRIEELAETAKSEKVKLAANQEILRQGGITPPQRVESIHIGIFGNASAEDMRNVVRAKIAEAKYDETGRLID